MDDQLQPGPSVVPDDQALIHQGPLEMDTPLSVEDHEAFAAHHLPIPPDLEQLDFQVHSWPLSNYRQLDRRMNSVKFECGGHKWDVLLFPLGNNNGGPKDEMLSIYLNWGGDTKSEKEGWHVCAQFALAISNPNDPTIFTCSMANHRFTAEEQDWGFTRFSELRKLITPSDGRTKPIIEDEKVVVTAFVRVVKDPTGVLWHNFQNYDSKLTTGHVGLKNQGATCYMNSLLQSLYLTNAFRKAVYQVPTDSDGPDSAIPLALQRVFYNLQTSKDSVGTQELTKSFGWNTYESFLQHDVEEFLRKLADKLETKMKDTPADGAIGNLLSGKMKSYIKCINVERESSKVDDYYDLQLNVRGAKNLDESFAQYVSEEILDGDNKYQAEGYGLQDAKKGVIFQTFPPVLHLHLKRFEYDFQRDQQVKINDRYEYPLEIDLTQYVEQEVGSNERFIYSLHGVLVHAGEVQAGHYYVFIKPTPDGKWLRFDDDRVIPVTEREVLEENFGGDILNAANKPIKGSGEKKKTSAYFLVYIRQKLVNEILAPIQEGDTPKHLRERLEAEKRAEDQKKREREEQHLYMQVKVITSDTFRDHQGFDLATFEDRTLPPSKVPTYRWAKQDSFLKFKQMLAGQFNVPPEEIRLWVLVNRQNKTVRPDTVVPENDMTLTVEAVRDKMASKQTDLRLYLEHVEPELKVKLSITDNSAALIMIFVKYFDYSKQSLHGVGHFYVSRHMKVADLVPMINERMGFPKDTPLKIYEEIKPGMIDPMKFKMTFLQSEIQDGDIVCFQVENSGDQVPEKDSTPVNDQTKGFTDAVQVYDWFQNRVSVQFKPKPDASGMTLSGTGDFDILLHKKLRHDEIAKRVGEQIDYDSAKIRLWGSSNGAPSLHAIKRSMLLSEIIQGSYNQTPNNLVFYELLDVPLLELEHKRTVKISWVGAFNREEAGAPHQFLLPKTNTVNDVIEHLAKKVTLTASGSQKIRLFTVDDSLKQQKLYNGSEALRDLPQEVFGEEIPIEELDITEKDKLIPVYHFNREPNKSHGLPFKLVARADEPFSETRKRLQARTGTSDKELAKMKFALIQPSTYTKPAYYKDEDIVFEHDWKERDCIGLDHVDKGPKRANAERSVMIG